MLGGVEYLGVDDEGLHVRVDGSEQTLPVDHVVICAGQEPFKPLAVEFDGTRAIPVHVIGGADVAAELDAKRAIAQASRLAAVVVAKCAGPCGAGGCRVCPTARSEAPTSRVIADGRRAAAFLNRPFGLAGGREAAPKFR